MIFYQEINNPIVTFQRYSIIGNRGFTLVNDSLTDDLNFSFDGGKTIEGVLKPLETLTTPFPLCSQNFDFYLQSADLSFRLWGWD